MCRRYIFRQFLIRTSQNQNYAILHKISQLYCRPPGFTVVSPGKYLAGGLQSGRTANLTGAQYKFRLDIHAHNAYNIIVRRL